jgi:hypothetical protein
VMDCDWLITSPYSSVDLLKLNTLNVICCLLCDMWQKNKDDLQSWKNTAQSISVNHDKFTALALRQTDTHTTHTPQHHIQHTHTAYTPRTPCWWQHFGFGWCKNTFYGFCRGSYASTVDLCFFGVIQNKRVSLHNYRTNHW